MKTLKTPLKLGPADHGRPLTREEYRTACYVNGHQYELIDGRLYVSPPPRFAHDKTVKWLCRHLEEYACRRPDVFNYVSARSAIAVAERTDPTEPEPDIAAFRDVPLDAPPEDVKWEEMKAVLVVEVISPDDPAKDLMRNPVLYLEVPSIREYWVIDPRPSANEPALYVYRRRGARWQPRITVPFGGVYTTRLLPGFSLVVDPRR